MIANVRGRFTASEGLLKLDGPAPPGPRPASVSGPAVRRQGFQGGTPTSPARTCATRQRSLSSHELPFLRSPRCR
ncbi:hypothetical protein [Streptomyces sp. 2A115]|uniref:hypothetical protein n=1 Tax=Streptomyces sp. 2A115 TaxID=3457439 RepID=UPI003FD400E5